VMKNLLSHDRRIARQQEREKVSSSLSEIEGRERCVRTTERGMPMCAPRAI